MKNISILVVEDDRSVAKLIMTTLKINEYSYTFAGTGRQAISLSLSMKPDLILLDLGLPDIDGMEVIESVRAWSSAIIIVISARGEDSDKIAALDMGADEYLTKPFSVDELLARIRAAQRRMLFLSENNERPVFVNGGLCVDYASYIVTVNGHEVYLTNIEYKLLCLLTRNAGKVLTHSYIIDKVWGNETISDIDSLRVYMASLRKKIRQEGHEDMILTRIGIGYQMVRCETSDEENR